MVSVELAKRLRAAGLVWRPQHLDCFHIPDRHLDDHVFVMADLSVEMQPLVEGISAIAFNGAVEWSLDYILQQDVVWLPTESQIRELVGDGLVSLERMNGSYRCVIDTGERFEAPTAADAYGHAVLSRLESKWAT